MNPQRETATIRGERGIILATVLVFLVVLSLTAFLGAGLTRSGIQVVNTLQNEKLAFSVAEAGITEALYRLSIRGDDPSKVVTVGGVTFNPSLATTVPGRGGAAPYGINYTVPLSTAQILFTSSAPSSLGTNSRTPTIQPSGTSRQPYTTATADTIVDPSSTLNLTIGWDVCTAINASTGCDPTSGFYPIRGLPRSNPRPVAKIVSTGRVLRPDGSVLARRRLTVWAVDAAEDTSDGGGITLLDPNCTNASPPGGIAINNGSATIGVAGALNVNSACDVAISGGNNDDINAAAISVTGQPEMTGNAPQYSTPPRANALPAGDPYATLLPPCFMGYVGACQNPPQSLGAECNTTPLSANFSCTVSSGTIRPGIYYGGLRITGNVTMEPGIYVMAGGGFATDTGNTSFTGNGVMIFNTANPLFPTTYGPISLATGNATDSLTAPTSGPWEDIIIFQDRNNTEPMTITSGNSSSWNFTGVVYVPSAPISILNNSNMAVTGEIVARSLQMRGGSDLGVDPGPAGNPKPSGVAYVPIAWQDF